jgi:hypothetical protein
MLLLAPFVGMSVSDSASSTEAVMNDSPTERRANTLRLLLASKAGHWEKARTVYKILESRAQQMDSVLPRTSKRLAKLIDELGERMDELESSDNLVQEFLTANCAFQDMGTAAPHIPESQRIDRQKLEDAMQQSAPHKEARRSAKGIAIQPCGVSPTTTTPWPFGPAASAAEGSRSGTGHPAAKRPRTSGSRSGTEPHAASGAEPHAAKPRASGSRSGTEPHAAKR